MAGRLLALGPHNHGLRRLWRFRDARLEAAYRDQCNAWRVHVVLLHTIGLTVAYAVTSSYYIGAQLTAGFWLYLACSAGSLVLAACVRLFALVRLHVVPLHAAYACALVAVAGALIFVQFSARTAEAAATWPAGLSPEARQPLQGFSRRYIGYGSFLSALVWAAAEWILLAVSGLTAWSAVSFCCTFVTFVACTLACPGQSASDTLNNAMFVCAAFLAMVVICLLLERLRRSNFLAQALLAQELRASQLADSILNHTLKNILADVAANLEVFLAGGGETTFLLDCIACLRRGMQSCKERQMYLKLAAGEYQPMPTPVRLPGLAHQLVAGRPVTVQTPDIEVLLDTTLMALILENAISNAFRHGSPEDPDVRLTISESIPEDEGPGSPSRHRHLQVTVSNAAHPLRPPLTPEDAGSLFRQKWLPRPVALDEVSFHIGLSHCVLAAKCGGIGIELRQEGDRVLFIASLEACELVPVTPPVSGRPSLPSATSPPSGLCFCCIDDSRPAQRLLTHHIQRSFPSATVHSFGATPAEVAHFLSTAGTAADVVILDQHLENEGVTTYGTDLLQRLIANSYAGLACIHSANDSPEDRAVYAASGAHCTLGKDMLGARMMEELAAAYARHVSLGGASAPAGRPPKLTAPPALPPADCVSYTLGSRTSSPSSHSASPMLPSGHSTLVQHILDIELHSIPQSPNTPRDIGPPQPRSDSDAQRLSLPGEVRHRTL
eukprot:EG_transcript_3026